MNFNSIRFDLSDWLIHFFRDIDLGGSNSITYPEHMGWGNVDEDVKRSALFMLRCAIRQGRLWATWSYRNDIRTIYGPNPAVCFTEMPIAAFLETGEARARRGEAMSQFALVFPKKDLFRVGANPVIYGLDDRSYWPPAGKEGKARIIDPNILPTNEQYRYVTYNPASDKPIDWSHEREWRWPYRGNLSAVEESLEKYGVVEDAMDIPGLNFYKSTISGMGVVVRNKEQASWIAHDILVLIDRGIITKNTYKFILAADELPPTCNLINPKDISQAISESIVDLTPIFSYDENELTEIAKRFDKMVRKVEANSTTYEIGEYGGCWLWILDNTSKLCRALLNDGRITVSESGNYLVDLYEFNESRSLRQRETMTTELAKAVENEFHVESGYFSVLNSDNPNDVPFYSDDRLDNRMHFNVSWEY